MLERIADVLWYTLLGSPPLVAGWVGWWYRGRQWRAEMDALGEQKYQAGFAYGVEKGAAGALKAHYAERAAKRRATVAKGERINPLKREAQ